MTTSDTLLDFLRFVEETPSRHTQTLLHRILQKSRNICSAEAGTIFMVRKKNRQLYLQPVSVQNDAVRVRRTDFMLPVDDTTIAGHVALSGTPLAIKDVYKIKKQAPYHFNPENEHPKYRTKSMLCFPLKNLQGKVIGVVQLINAKRKNQTTQFTKAATDLVSALSSVIGHFLERSLMLHSIQNKNRTLTAKSRTIAMLQTQTEEAFQHSIVLLSRAAEIHDEDTGNHVLRVNHYSKAFGELLGMPAAWCQELGYSAQLHDVGKMSINSAVLKKRGKLTQQERNEMNKHTLYGYQILHKVPRFEMAAEIALHHHERWDGTGYPHGLKEKAIPLSARIVQIADIYDALRSARSYKPAWSHKKTVQVLTRGDDRITPKAHFDPELITLFKKNNKRFQEIWHDLRG